MRVLQVLGRSAGGIARHVAQIVEALDGEGFEIDVAAPPDLPVEMPKPVLPLVIPGGPRGHRAAVRDLSRYLEHRSYDVIHAHGLRAGIDAGRAAGKHVPLLLTVHNLVRPEIAGRWKAPLYRLSEPLAVRAARRTFAVSDEIARHLRRNPAARRASIEVLYLGVGPPPVVTKSRAEVRNLLGLSDEPLVVTASRLSRQKALSVMLDAVARLEGVAVAVLGEGEQEEELRRHAGELGIEVRWLGFRRDVADFVAAADVFCLSSIWEGVPLAVQEAILLGTPVVATRVGGMPEIVTDGVSGRLVPPGAPDELAAALRQVIEDEGLRRRYTERAAADLKERFSTERMLARLREAYAAEGRGADHEA